MIRDIKINYQGNEHILKVFELDGFKDDITFFYEKSKTFYEINLLEHIKKKFGKIKTWVDVGSSIGNHLVFAHHYLGAENIYGFEPFIGSFEALKENCGEFAKLYNTPLGAEEKKVALSLLVMPEQKLTGLGQTQIVDGDKLDMKTLDSFNIPQIDILKIDVENYESEVLKGAIQTIKRTRPVIYLEQNNVDLFRDCFFILEPLDYVATSVLMDTNVVVEFVPKEKICQK